MLGHVTVTAAAYVAQVMIVAAPPSAQKTKVTLRLARESRLVESQVGRDGFRGKTFARQFLVTCYYGRGVDGDRSSLKSSTIKGCDDALQKWI